MENEGINVVFCYNGGRLRHCVRVWNWTLNRRRYVVVEDSLLYGRNFFGTNPIPNVVISRNENGQALNKLLICMRHVSGDWRTLQEELPSANSLVDDRFLEDDSGAVTQVVKMEI